MASIKRRRGKYHVVYYYLNEDGEKKQKWESFDTEAEAKHRKAEIEYKQGSRTFIAPSKTTVAAFLEDFVSLYGTKKWSPSTYEANTGLIRNYINPKLGSIVFWVTSSCNRYPSFRRSAAGRLRWHRQPPQETEKGQPLAPVVPD